VITQPTPLTHKSHPHLPPLISRMTPHDSKRAVILSWVDAHAAGQSRCRTIAASAGVAGSLMIYDCR
jgi:hypothetical protein